jgi:large subunit ribosomal protein L30
MPRTFVWHPKRGPRRAPRFNLPEKGQVQIKQIRSGIGNTWRMRRTLRALGLKHHQDVVVQEMTPGLRGQIEQVRHLIEVKPVEKAGEKTAKRDAAKAKESK